MRFENFCLMVSSCFISWRLLAVLFFILEVCTWTASSAVAQQQEHGLLDRLEHPDRTLHYSPSDKQFSTSSAVGGKEAAVRPFLFGRSAAALRAGDGAFSTHAFHGKDGYHADAFATHAAPAAGQGFVQTNKTFGTKTMDVREDRAANQTMPVQEYSPGEKLFLERGKRQDTIDELRRQKNLTVDQVREILNKNK